MPGRHALLPTVLISVLLSLVAPPNSRGQSGPGKDCRERGFTLVIPIQSDRPGNVIARLQQRGIPLVGVTIERWGTVTWTHITVGLFGSVEEAGRYGQSLVSRGIVETYLVETRPGCGDVTRPRTVTHDQQYGSYFLASAINSPARLLPLRSEKRAGVGWDPPSKHSINDPPMSAPSRSARSVPR